MKKAAVGFFCGVGVLTLVCALASVSLAAAGKPYKHDRFKYSVEYPADYQVKTLGTAVVFVSPLKDKKFEFSPNINIVCSFIKEPVPALYELYKISKAKLEADTNTVKIIEDKKDKVANVDAYKLVYTSKQKKAFFKLMQRFFIYKTKMYVITYTALQDQYDKSLPQALSVIKSFKFLD